MIDTTMIQFSGIVAREIGRLAAENNNKEKSEEYYRKSIEDYHELAELGFGGAAHYVQMTRDYYAIGDTLGAIENLKEGIKEYPDSSLLVTVAAQAYYLMGDNEDGIKFVDQRIKDKPDCAAAYYWKALFITNEDDVEEAVIKNALAYYDTSLMYNPTDQNVMYQSGYVNYAVGADYFERESYEEDKDLRDQLNKTGTEYYEAAVEKLEKAYDLSQNDPTIKKQSLDLLKRIYYKLYGGEDERYLDVNKRLNEM